MIPRRSPMNIRIILFTLSPIRVREQRMELNLSALTNVHRIITEDHARIIGNLLFMRFCEFYTPTEGFERPFVEFAFRLSYVVSRSKELRSYYCEQTRQVLSQQFHERGVSSSRVKLINFASRAQSCSGARNSVRKFAFRGGNISLCTRRCDTRDRV